MEADVRPDRDQSQDSSAELPPGPVEHVAPRLQAIYSGLSAYPFHSDSEYQAGLAAILGHPETPANEEEVRDNGDLVVQAKCFYFTRKHNLAPIDPADYIAWLEAPSATPPMTMKAIPPPPPPPAPAPRTPSTNLSPTAAVFTPASVPSSSAFSPKSSSPPPSAQPNPDTNPPTAEPPYPTSFAAIVDLITRNVPVPGIEEIPTTVLEPGSSKVDKTPRRKKPWEDRKSTAGVDDEHGSGGGGTGGVSAVQTAPAAAGGDITSTTTKVDLNGHRRTGQGVVNILKPNAIPDSGLLAKD